MCLISLTFFVRKFVKYGEGVYISGNVPELGNWNPEKALKLFWRPGDNWTQRIKIECSEFPIKLEYKVLIMPFDIRDGCNPEWEKGLNSCIKITKDMELKIEDLSDLSDEDENESQNDSEEDLKSYFNYLNEPSSENLDPSFESLSNKKSSLNFEDKQIFLGTKNKLKNPLTPEDQILLQNSKFFSQKFKNDNDKSNETNFDEFFPNLKSSRRLSFNGEKEIEKEVRAQINNKHSNHPGENPDVLKKMKNELNNEKIRKNDRLAKENVSFSLKNKQYSFSTYSQSFENLNEITEKTFKNIKKSKPEFIGLQYLNDKMKNKCCNNLISWMGYGMSNNLSLICPIWYNFSKWEPIDGEVIHQQSIYQGKKEQIITWLVLKSRSLKVNILVLNTQQNANIIGGLDLIYGIITNIITKFYHLCNIKRVILFGDFDDDLGDFETVLNRFNIRPFDKGLGSKNRVFSSDIIRINHSSPEITFCKDVKELFMWKDIDKNSFGLIDDFSESKNESRERLIDFNQKRKNNKLNDEEDKDSNSSSGLN